MFTRCPNCDTHFEITQEYLDIAHGKVRCGQCDHIFNALDNLYENEESKAEIENNTEKDSDSKPEDQLNPQEDIPASNQTESVRPEVNTETIEKDTDAQSSDERESSFNSINIKEKMERISASLSAASKELKAVRETPETEKADDLSETNDAINEKKIIESNEVDEIIPESEETAIDEIDINKGETEIIDEDEIEIIDEDETEISNEDENDFEIIDYHEENSDHDQSYPLIDTTTRTTDAADMDVLNSLMETPAQENLDGFQRETIETEADLKLFDDFDNITKVIPDNSNNSLDDELSSLDDDFDDLDDLDGDDLLAELDQIESDFLHKEKHDAQKDSEQASSLMADNTSAIPDDTTQSANTYATNQDVVPSFLTQEDTPQSQPTAVFGWLAATIAFLFVLAGQYVYFNSKDFAQNPQMHALVKPFCQLTGCSLPLIKTPRKIITVTHDVRTFASIKNSLEIQLTFKNKASYTQGYPLLEITFLNPAGNIVARRKFSPAEYMSSADNYDQGLKSNQSQDINLKIVDPDPTSLLSFQFNYL